MTEILQRPEVTHFHDVSAPYQKEYDRETPEGYSFRVRREKVLALLPEGSGKKILDLASGPGVMIKDLRSRGYSVTCVDAAPGMIELAKEVAGSDPAVSCEVGDAYALRFEKASFDVVTAMGLIEYLSDEDKYIAETARILKDGGTAIITFPNVWSPWRAWNRILRSLVWILKKKHSGLLHREYTVKRAKQLMETHGLKVDAVSYYNVKLVPLPLDRLLPRFTVWFSAALEWFALTPLRFTATGFILRAEKRS
jgi:ubiquinone/menaquinone biosynthesis C-methylase UbiE